MEASIVDLRYHMREVLEALARNEQVTILYHGKKTGILMPYKSKKPSLKIENTALFGMYKNDKENVSNVIKELRKGRYHDI